MKPEVEWIEEGRHEKDGRLVQTTLSGAFAVKGSKDLGGSWRGMWSLEGSKGECFYLFGKY